MKKVEISNVNTSKLKVLTNAENKELFRQMNEGVEGAREQIISRKFKISIKCNSKIWRTWREFRRFISSGVCGADKSYR